VDGRGTKDRVSPADESDAAGRAASLEEAECSAHEDVEPEAVVNRFLYAALALAGGALIAAQAPINARLRVRLASPIGSALVSFAVGTLLLLVATLAVGDGSKVVSNLGGGPWWAYLGGACGAVFVFAALTSSPRVGVTATFVAVILGQVLAAALIDQFGWFGAKVHAFGWERAAAIGLLLVSLVLLVRE
jgi:transporter family-2 protein